MNMHDMDSKARSQSLSVYDAEKNITSCYQNGNNITKEIFTKIFIDKYFKLDYSTTKKNMLSELKQKEQMALKLAKTRSKKAIEEYEATFGLAIENNFKPDSEFSFALKKLLKNDCTKFNNILNSVHCVFDYVLNKNRMPNYKYTRMCSDVNHWFQDNLPGTISVEEFVDIISLDGIVFKLSDLFVMTTIEKIASNIDFSALEKPDINRLHIKNYGIIKMISFWKETWVKIVFKIFKTKISWKVKSEF